MRKTAVEAHYSCIMQKNRSKKQLILKNETILKIGKKGHNAKAIAFPKWSVWVKNSKYQKHAIKDSTTTLDLFYAKNGSKKQLIFEKWDYFENWQKWPLCKGYSLCKVVSLGQKLKLRKECEKQLQKHITVVLCKKRLQKTANIRKMRPFWKLAKKATMQRL